MGAVLVWALTPNLSTDVHAGAKLEIKSLLDEKKSLKEVVHALSEALR